MGLINDDARPPVVAESKVQVIILGELGVKLSSPNMLSVDDPLKKSWLMKSMKVPKTMNGKELISKSSSC